MNTEHHCEIIINFLRKNATSKDGVFQQYFGLNGESLTAKEIAKKNNCSTQNVFGIIKNKLKKLNIAPQDLSESILDSWNRGTLEVDFQFVASCFDNNQSFYKFLSMASGLKAKSFQPTTKLKESILLSLFAHNQSPLNVETVLSSIDAENGEIFALIKKCISTGSISQNNNFIYAEQLPRKYAFAQAALQIDRSASADEIMSLAAGLDLMSDKDKQAKTYNRLLKECANENIIYSCEKGKFRHTHHLHLTNDKIMPLLRKVKSILKSSSFEVLDIKSVQKQMDNCNVNYYELRYIIRNYGESVGIHYNGLSQSDSISLNESFERLNQHGVLKRWLQDKEVITPNDIKTVIRTPTSNNVQRVIQELMEQGQLQRIGASRYKVVHQ